VVKTLQDYIETTIEEEEYWKMKANDMQVGGSHYKDMGVQPWDVMEAVLTREEFIGFLKGNIIKYAMRQGKKDSDDASKCNHYCQKLSEIVGDDSWT
jgi:hypothetical protein